MIGKPPRPFGLETAEIFYRRSPSEFRTLLSRLE